MKTKGLEGTPLGEYAKELEEQKREETANTQKISVEQTEKGTTFTGLHQDEDRDPYADLGYKRK